MNKTLDDQLDERADGYARSVKIQYCPCCGEGSIWKFYYDDYIAGWNECHVENMKTIVALENHRSHLDDRLHATEKALIESELEVNKLKEKLKTSEAYADEVVVQATKQLEIMEQKVLRMEEYINQVLKTNDFNGLK